MGNVIKGTFGGGGTSGPFGSMGTSGVGNAGNPLGIGGMDGGGLGQTMNEPEPPAAGAPAQAPPTTDQLSWQLDNVITNVKTAAGRLTTAMPPGAINDSAMKAMLETFGVLESNAAALLASIQQIAGVSPEKGIAVQKDMDEFQQQGQSFIEAVEGAIQRAVGEGAAPLAGLSQTNGGRGINWIGVGVLAVGLGGIGFMLWRMRK